MVQAGSLIWLVVGASLLGCGHARGRFRPPRGWR